MFNVTVIRLRDIIKYIAITLAIYFFSKIVINNNFFKWNIQNKKNWNIDKMVLLGINDK